MLIKYLMPLIAVCLTCCKGNNFSEKHQPARFKNDSVLSFKGFTFIENENITRVAAPVSGRISSIRTETGNYVSAGQILSFLENSDIIILQKEYLEAQNELEFHGREYARQGDLTVENATSLKRMEAAKHDYTTAELNYQSLRKQLTMLGLIPDSVSSGNIRPTISIRSPVKGITTETYVRKGQFIEKGEALFDIAENRSLLLRLNIPEEYIWVVRKDQKFKFYCYPDTLKAFEAIVVKEASEIDPLTQSGLITAKPLEINDLLLPGMSVKATICLSDSIQ